MWSNQSTGQETSSDDDKIIYMHIVHTMSACILLQYIGRVGVVNTVQDSGDIIVRYSNNKIFLINQFALTKVLINIIIINCAYIIVCSETLM